MRQRKQTLGTKNIIGERVSTRRKEMNLKQKDLLLKLQAKGVDLTSSGLSKLEGQIRTVNDFELLAISEALGVSVEWLLGIS